MQNTKTIILNAEQVAEAIQFKYGVVLNQAPPGIYLRHGISPVIVPNKKYHSFVKTEDGVKPIDVTSVEMIKTAVYDEEENVVINLHTARNGLFSEGPTRPVMAADLVKRVIEAAIDNSCKHYTGPKMTMDDVIQSKFADELFSFNVSMSRPQRQELEDKISQITDGIKTDLYEIWDAAKSFAKEKPWAMYRIFEVNGLDVGIERGMDYRVYSWHLDNNIPIGPGDE